MTDADVADGPSDPLTSIDIDPPITSQSFDFSDYSQPVQHSKGKSRPYILRARKGRSKEHGPSGPSKFLSDVQLPSASSEPQISDLQLMLVSS